MVLSTASDAETRGAVMDDASKAASAVEYVCAIDGCNNVATRVRQFNRDPNFVYRWCNETHAGGTLKPKAMPLPVVLTRAPDAIEMDQPVPVTGAPCSRCGRPVVNVGPGEWECPCDESCNCDELIAAREEIARLKAQYECVDCGESVMGPAEVAAVLAAVLAELRAQATMKYLDESRVGTLARFQRDLQKRATK